MNRTTLYPNDDENTSVWIGDSANRAAQAIPNTAKWLALGAIAGPILFTLAWLVLGFLSPGYTIWGTLVAPYSPISQPISGLGLGPTARYMNTAFVFCGFLIMIGAVGLGLSMREIGRAGRWACSTLLALTGLGMVMAGIFTLESIILHTLGFLVGTGAPVLSFLVIGLLFRRIPRRRRLSKWLLLASPLTLVLLILSFATFDPVRAGAGLGIAGLTQRTLVVEIHAWFVALGWLAFRQS